LENLRIHEGDAAFEMPRIGDSLSWFIVCEEFTRLEKGNMW